MHEFALIFVGAHEFAILFVSVHGFALFVSVHKKCPVLDAVSSPKRRGMANKKDPRCL
jgi:hypothetical protein